MIKDLFPYLERGYALYIRTTKGAYVLYRKGSFYVLSHKSGDVFIFVNCPEDLEKKVRELLKDVKVWDVRVL